MIIIGELINGTRKAVAAAIAGHDAEYIAKLARDQEAAGACYIDCNAGTSGDKEIEDLVWLVQVVQQEVSVPLSLDSPNPAALERALEIYTGPAPLINSITAEEERIKQVLPLLQQTESSVIALLLGDSGMPEGVAQRLANAEELVGHLEDSEIAPDRIYIDPLVVPLGTNHEAGTWVLDTILALRQSFRECHITGGLSNISYGMPNRRLLNRVFATMCVARGLDSAVIDPLDRELMASLVAAEAIAGHDEWCMNYLQAYREGRLE